MRNWHRARIAGLDLHLVSTAAAADLFESSIRDEGQGYGHGKVEGYWAVVVVVGSVGYADVERDRCLLERGVKRIGHLGWIWAWPGEGALKALQKSISSLMDLLGLLCFFVVGR